MFRGLQGCNAKSGPICHKPGTEEEETKTITIGELALYQGLGDTVGPCGDRCTLPEGIKSDNALCNSKFGCAEDRLKRSTLQCNEALGFYGSPPASNTAKCTKPGDRFEIASTCIAAKCTLPEGMSSNNRKCQSKNGCSLLDLQDGEVQCAPGYVGNPSLRTAKCAPQPIEKQRTSSTVQYSTAQYSTVQYSTVQRSSVQRCCPTSVAQSCTVQCSTVQRCCPKSVPQSNPVPRPQQESQVSLLLAKQPRSSSNPVRPRKASPVPRPQQPRQSSQLTKEPRSL